MSQLTPTKLQLPAAEARVHSQVLLERIVSEIRESGGAVGFDTFMEAALYQPGYGYYSAGVAKFGAAGDFVTAPELSPVFGRCVTRQLVQWLTEQADWQVVEVGAGSGALAANVVAGLGAGEESSSLASRRYSILERSADLRARQLCTLVTELGEDGVAGRVSWLDDLPPPGFKGVILANELLDALPAKLFEVTAEGFVERCVEERDGTLAFSVRAPGDLFAAELDALRRDLPWTLARGYRSEFSQAAPAWIRTVAERMQEGVMLLFDYGYPRREYYHEQRSGGTLRCYYRHRAHENPFLYPGLQDISVHVDFTAIAKAAVDCGLQVAGFTSQAAFLLATGLLEFAQELDPGTPEQVAASRQLRQLMMPGEMGEAVKVIALTKRVQPGLLGFQELDYRPRLGL